MLCPRPEPCIVSKRSRRRKAAGPRSLLTTKSCPLVSASRNRHPSNVGVPHVLLSSRPKGEAASVH